MVSPVLAGKVVAMGLLTCSMISTISHAAVAASDSNPFSIGIQLSYLNKMCGSLPNAYVMISGIKQDKDTSEVCLLRDSIVRTKNGLRYIIVYSFTDSMGIVSMHDLSWFEVDCSSMMRRKFRDGSILLVREREGRSIGAKSINKLQNGWFLYVFNDSRLPSWKPLYSDILDRSVARSCQVSSNYSPNIPAVAPWGSEKSKLLDTVRSQLSGLEQALQNSNTEIAQQTAPGDVLDSKSFRPARA